MFNASVSSEETEALISGCVFVGNFALLSGGGMHNLFGATPNVMACVFRGNLSNSGAGVYNGQTSPEFTNCLFNGNAATGPGGGSIGWPPGPLVRPSEGKGSVRSVRPS